MADIETNTKKLGEKSGIPVLQQANVDDTHTGANAATDPLSVVSEQSKNTAVGESAAAINREGMNEKSGESPKGDSDALKKYTAAVKRRRRSVIPDEVQTTLEPSEKTSVVSSSNAIRRKSVLRRSLSAIVPTLSVKEQVARLVSESGDVYNRRATLSQLLDITVRSSVLHLCSQSVHSEQLSPLKGAVMLGSEQMSEETIKQWETKCYNLDEILPAPKRFRADTEKAAISQNKINNIKCRDQDEVLYKQWLMKKYLSESERLLEERKIWKELKKTRKNQLLSSRSQYSQSRTGAFRINEDQESLLPSAHRVFLRARPQYQKSFELLQEALQSYVSTLARSEAVLGRIKTRNIACEAAADRAYELISLCSRGNMIRHTPQTLLRNLQAAFPAAEATAALIH